MNNDEIYKTVEHQAILKCGRLWADMNEKERLNAMFKVSIMMIKGLSDGK